MDTRIEIVPAIRWVELEHVGCWTSIRLEFINGLNIITSDGCGSGKSTILRAIVSAIHIHSSSDFRNLSPTKGFGEGSISIEFMSKSIRVRLDRKKRVQSTSGRLETLGEFTLRRLRSYLESAEAGTAVLFDNEILAALARAQFSEAVELLNKSHTQTIFVKAHLDPRDFPKARIYVCSWDRENNTAHIMLQQAGGEDSR